MEPKVGDIRIGICRHTDKEVLQSYSPKQAEDENNGWLCLHGETKEEDRIAVEKFRNAQKEKVFPVQSSVSYVDEFLREVTENGKYYRSNVKEIISKWKYSYFQEFCKELEILREQSKIVNQFVEHLKQKNESPQI